MPTNPAFLKRLVHKIYLIEDAILAFLLFGMIFLASTQIFMRNFFDSGFIWADPLLRNMVLWIALLGALAATRENKHISIDLLTRYLTESYRDLVKAFTNLFSIVVALLLAYHSLRFVMLEYESQSIAFSGLPAWVMELILPIAFSLIALRFGIHFVINVRFIMASSKGNRHG